MRKNKKGQFELSISFLVKLVLGMAIFGVGIWFAFMIFNKGTDIINPNADLCKEYRCDPNEALCIPEATKQMDAKGTSYCVIVNNLYPDGKTFKLSIQNPKEVGAAAAPYAFETVSSLGNAGTFYLVKNEPKNINIMLYKNQTNIKRQYSMDVVVTYSDTSGNQIPYETQKIYINT
jgi:hypothetical protein